MTTLLTGGCLCGAVRYTVAAEITGLRACHCTHCQKSSGTGGSVNAVLPSAAFTLTQGVLKRYADKANSGRTLFRHFCGDCGSPVTTQRETTPETVVLRAGTLDRKDGLKIVAQIWTASAAPWSTIDPAIDQRPGNPD